MFLVRFDRPPSVPDAAGSPGPFPLAGGVVAYNEEPTIGPAIRSLLAQELPPGASWSRIWVVTSGCTDRTGEMARRVAEEDARVSVVEEPERTGKSHALREVFRRARGTAVVLLNGDARAEPGAVQELIRTAQGLPKPYAVMAQPVVGPEARSRWSGPIRSMWQLHHDFHRQLQLEGGGAHLSDELLLLSLDPLPPLPEGIINEGSYLAVWLAQRDYPRRYAPRARVTVGVASNLRDHLRQRRRINVGDRQVATTLGMAPSTLFSYALRQPGTALGLVRRSLDLRPTGLVRFASLATAELAARALAGWDRILPTKDHVRWDRIERERPVGGEPAMERSPIKPPPSDPVAAPYERRLRTLVEAAGWFGTGIGLDEVVELLPQGSPPTSQALAEWVAAHPEVGAVEGGQLVSRALPPEPGSVRRDRGIRYHESARRLVEADLARTRRWLRCVGVTGSTAYGEPESGDDLDFFVVTRTGALWWFLAVTYTILRLRRWAGLDGGRPEPCFNYVLDDSTVLSEFAAGSGFLFARESLAVRVIEGDGYYRGVLARTSWIGEEIPRMYRTRTQSPEDCAPSRAPAAIRVLNALVFPLLATYLRLVGLRRSARGRRSSPAARSFGTQTGYHRLAIVSRRFEHLRHRYDQGLGLPASAYGPLGPSRIPTDR